MSNDQKLPESAVPTELDEQALAQVHAGTRHYTGGRFQLDITTHSVGYLNAAPPSQGEEGAPAAVPPSR